MSKFRLWMGTVCNNFIHSKQTQVKDLYKYASPALPTALGFRHYYIALVASDHMCQEILHQNFNSIT